MGFLLTERFAQVCDGVMDIKKAIRYPRPASLLLACASIVSDTVSTTGSLDYISVGKK